MTKYASALFTFAAAVVAVYGDTHNPAKAGLAGITWLGWVAAAVALVSCVVIIVETRRDHAKINWEIEQRSKVRRTLSLSILID
jgi:cytochrome c-type biogenesis protein CcmH/NrfF